ncbi:MAG TPA: hypothetical protein VJ928_10320 [Marivita sp.]|nr:hypothetical protein [Marivita sp.]
MTVQNMYGVVLWSDANAQKAVIWCEDQGELAFYTPCEQSLHDAPVLDAGDLIQFDVVVKQNMRKATNPQLLESSHSPDLPANLKSSQPADAKGTSAQKVVDISQYFDAKAEEPLRRSG